VSLDEFAVPSRAEWVDALGIEPESVDLDPGVRRLYCTTDRGDAIDLTFDIPGNSVRCRWLREGNAVLDLFRESARNLVVHSGKGEAFVIVTFEADGLRGELSIRLWPEILITDQMLFG
jgi:hypothetical protein